MGFLTMKSPFLQNINKANHAVDMFIRHHLQGLEAGVASNNSPGQLSHCGPTHWSFPRLPPQDYLEATKPTDIIPQPKKTIATITLAHSKLQTSSPRNQQQKTRTPFPPPNIPKKNGQTSSWPREYGHAPLPGFVFYSIHKAGCWGVSCWAAGCCGRRWGWMKDLAKL